MKCVLYTRVSSSEQEKEGYSIPAQRKLLQEYADKCRLSIVEEFSDVETAKAAGRSQFGKMATFCKVHPDVKIILVEKTDRLYRNFRDYILVEDLGVDVHLVKENEVIGKGSRSHAKFIHGIKLLMAKNYIDNLSEEVRKGMREKAEQGQWPQRAPVGYKNNKETRLVEVDPIRAALVIQMFRLFAGGRHSLSETRREMYQRGLSASGRQISKSQVEQILKNPFYFGEYDWGGVRYAGVHEPIIDRDLFDQVQSILRSASRPRKRSCDFAYRGLMKCARCGCAIVGEEKKGKYVYYHCTGGKGKCSQPYVRQEALDEALEQVVSAIQLTPAMANDILEALRTSSANETAFRRDELARLRTQHDQLQHRLDKAYEDRMDGVIDEGYWSGVSLRWRNEQNRVSEQIRRLESANRSYVDTAVQILELSQCLYGQFVERDSFQKRRLLDTVLSNCTLDGLTVTPTYRKPFDLIAEGLKLQEMLPR